MKNNRLKWTMAWLAVAICAGLAQARAATLKVGDAAPKLQTGKWVQGDPVKSFDKGKTYIVEFWATWCGPCRTTIPHLNDLHKKYEKKGLVVIGQDCWERDESKVEPFVKQMGEKMTYRVAMDDKSEDEAGAMAKNWMAAAGQSGIPSAFVVDGAGKIAWIGHPMTLKDKTLEQIIEGTYDLKKAADEAAEEVKNQAQIRTLSQSFGKAMRGEKWDEAETALNDISKLMPEDQRDNLIMPRAQIAFGKKDYKAGYKLYEQMSDNNKDNAGLQNRLAWDIATKEGLEERDLKLAEKIATRGVEASKSKDAAILDTLARVQFMSGQKDKAIETQQKAVDLADEDRKDDFRKTLDSYKAGKLPKGE